MKTFGALRQRLNVWLTQRKIRRELRQLIRANQRADKFAVWLLKLVQHMEAQHQTPGLLSLLPLRVQLLTRAVGARLRKTLPSTSQKLDRLWLRLKQRLVLGSLRLLLRLTLSRLSSSGRSQ